MENNDKEFLESLYKRNAVLYEKGRFYFMSLNQRRYDFETTTPYYIEICDDIIGGKTWKDLIKKICVYLQRTHYKELTDLYSFRVSWSSAQLFGSSKFSTNCLQVNESLFCSHNFTATHSVWFIQDLLDFYNIDKSLCTLVIKRTPYSESPEVTNIVIEFAKNEFRQFLYTYYDADLVNKILVNFDEINKVQSKISTTFYNFYLLSSKQCLSNNKSFFFNKLFKYTSWSPSQINTAKKILDLYSKCFAQMIKRLSQTIF